MLQKITIPKFEYKTKVENDDLYIFDIIRKKYILLTPEEWVRQGLIHYLINDFNYPKGMMQVETGLKYDHRQKRSDILVYDRNTNPFLLIECKSMEVSLGQNTLEQVSQYNLSIQAKYIMISNGLEFSVFLFDKEKREYATINKIPIFEE